MKVLLGAVNAKYIHSNLAVYCLKAYAEKYGDTSDEISIGEYTINQQLDEILRDIYKRKPDMLCLSCYIWNLTYVEEICREIKKVMPQIIIWIGGPEVSYDGVKVLERLPEVDGVMKGEGEQTFCDLLHFYQDKTVDGLQNMKGIVYREQTGQIVENEWRKTMDLSKVPFVYENMELFEHKIIYYETSRGCPFSCSYCLSSIDKRIRFRDIDIVKKELQFFLDNNTAQVKFVDRTFNCNKNHAMEIWQYIKDHDNGITNFHFEIAADLTTKEELELMKTMRPGLIQLEIGVQSTNEKTLEAINRKTDIKEIEEITSIIKKGKNIHQHLDLIVGLPYEDYQSFGKSFNDVYRMKPDQLQLGFLKVLHGSMMEVEAAKYEIEYSKRPPYEVLKTKWVSFDDVLKLKEVEAVVEIYYNSLQFVNTMEALDKYFETPFEMFEKLGEFYKQNSENGVKHSRVNRYNLLLEFIEKTLNLQSEELERFRELLTFDFYLRENAKSRPTFAKNQEQYKKQIRSIYRNEALLEKMDFYKEFNSKQFEHMTHIEVIDGKYLLFDYKNRDPLSKAANIINVTKYVDGNE